MVITSVIYQRKRSDRAYGNRSMQVTADLDEHDDPASVALILRNFVQAALADDEQEEEERNKKREEEMRARYLAEREERARHLQQYEDGEDDDEDDEDEEDLP